MSKPRIIISTDIGGADPDDMQSMAHALLAADQWQIEALISTPTGHGGRASDIHKALDAYARDYANLKTWSSDYPDPDYLESIVYQGNINVAPSAGYSNSTAASQAIVKAAHEAKAAGEPLWVMAWGALTDVAQALHDDPSIASTIRVLASNGWNGDQDPNAYNYVVDTHAGNGLWMIDSKSTHRGIYIDADGRKNNPFDLDKVKGDGALGEYFDAAVDWNVKMGDSWSIAYLTDSANNGNPQADSWGGEFVKNGRGPNYWTDDPDPAYKIAWYNGAKHVREHQTDIYGDMYKLFDRADRPKPDSGDGTDSSSSGGTGDSTGSEPLIAVDNQYAVEPDGTLWFNARYLTWNDKGGDGALTVTGIAGTTAAGVAVSMADNGTIVYRAPSGWQGTDSLAYTVQDADGSTDTAEVFLTVGHGTDPLPSPGGDATAKPVPDTGSGEPVVAVDNHYDVEPGKAFWFNTGYLDWNDKGGDGELTVTGIADTTAAGVEVSWRADGTVVYRPPSGWQGTDSLTYTVQDADGSTDTAEVFLTVGHGADPLPPPDEDAAAEPAPDTGSGEPVVAADNYHTVEPDGTLWFNARYLTWNDKGGDGALTVTGITDTTAAGVAVSMADNGTIVYRAPSGWQGTDSLTYTVQDADGSIDTAEVFLTVGHGTDPLPSPGGDATAEPAPDAGSGEPVVAVDNQYRIDAGQTLWFNTRYLTWNDKGPDGGLQVTSLDSVSKAGVEVSWGPDGSDADGTAVYRPLPGWEGIDSLSYTVQDADGSTDTGTVFIQVGAGDALLV